MNPPQNQAGAAPASNRRWWALFALVPAVLAVGLDSTVLSVALPTLGDTLHASTGELQWFVVAYSLAISAAMIPGGMLGDRYGRRRLLLISLVVFMVGSLACAYAPNAGAFIGARVVLGLGAAVIMPMVLGALPALFAPEERTKAMSVIMGVTMLGFPIGPLLGGWLLSHAWWGWVFLMNVPVSLIGLAAVAGLVPESRAGTSAPIDLAGIALSALGLGLITDGAIRAGDDGWGSTTAVALLTTGVLVITGFVVVERRRPHPLVDLGIFRSAAFTWGAILATLLSFAMFGLLFVVPLTLQAVQGHDAQGTGLRLLPLVIGLIIGALPASVLASRLGAKTLVGAGFVVMAIGMVIGSHQGAEQTSTALITWLGLTGIGLGLALPTSMDIALGAIDPEAAGTGSGLLQALRMVGGTLGAAVLGSIASGVYRSELHLGGLPPAAAGAARNGVVSGVTVAQRLGDQGLLDQVRLAFVHGGQTLLLVCAVIALASAALAVVTMPRRVAPSSDPADGARPDTAADTAQSHHDS